MVGERLKLDGQSGSPQEDFDDSARKGKRGAHFTKGWWEGVLAFAKALRWDKVKDFEEKTFYHYM